MSSDSYRQARHQMIERCLKPQGIVDSSVLDAFAIVPRHRFVPDHLREVAYENQMLNIGHVQMMLPPLTIAKMLQALMLRGDEHILEIGTGSGYLTAILMHLGRYVFSLEQDIRLAQQASERLASQQYDQVDLHIGDGSQGLPDMAPFDIIIATSAIPKVPRLLASQLSYGGRLIIPVGRGRSQRVKLLRRLGDQWQARTLFSIRTTRLQGRHGFQPGNSAQK